MRGKVLAYDVKTGAGMISGDDGKRYSVGLQDVRGGATLLIPGRDVDFEPGPDGRAAEIYQLAGTGLAGEKNRMAAALIALFAGALGIHKFYLGKRNAGIIMLLCTFPGILLVVPFFVIAVIAFIEAIIYLTKDDQTFHAQYVVGDKAWF